MDGRDSFIKVIRQSNGAATCVPMGRSGPTWQLAPSFPPHLIHPRFVRPRLREDSSWGKQPARGTTSHMSHDLANANV